MKNLSSHSLQIKASESIGYLLCARFVIYIFRSKIYSTTVARINTLHRTITCVTVIDRVQMFVALFDLPLRCWGHHASR